MRMPVRHDPNAPRIQPKRRLAAAQAETGSPRPESAPRAARHDPSFTNPRFGVAVPHPPRHVEGHREVLQGGPRCGGSRIPPLGAGADELEPVCGLHRRRRRSTRGERLRLDHAGPTTAQLGGNRGRIPPLDVHGARLSRSGPRSPHRSRGDSICEGSGSPRDAPPRVTVRRADLRTSRLRANEGDAIIPGPEEASTADSRRAENAAARPMTARSGRARKPSNTTLIYEPRTDACS